MIQHELQLVDNVGPNSLLNDTVHLQSTVYFNSVDSYNMLNLVISPKAFIFNRLGFNVKARSHDRFLRI